MVMVTMVTMVVVVTMVFVVSVMSVVVMVVIRPVKVVVSIVVNRVIKPIIIAMTLLTSLFLRLLGQMERFGHIQQGESQHKQCDYWSHLGALKSRISLLFVLRLYPRTLFLGVFILSYLARDNLVIVMQSRYLLSRPLLLFSQ